MTLISTQFIHLDSHSLEEVSDLEAQKPAKAELNPACLEPQLLGAEDKSHFSPGI